MVAAFRTAGALRSEETIYLSIFISFSFSVYFFSNLPSIVACLSRVSVDGQTRYRQRYLDLMMNDETRRIFQVTKTDQYLGGVGGGGCCEEVTAHQRQQQARSFWSVKRGAEIGPMGRGCVVKRETESF